MTPGLLLTIFALNAVLYGLMLLVLFACGVPLS